MNIQDIKERMAQLPTMMGLEEEKFIIETIMMIDPKSLNIDVQNLSDVMSDLLVSRSTSFYDITGTDKAFFNSFAKWLLDISTLFENPRKAEFVDLARIYSTFPDK